MYTSSSIFLLLLSLVIFSNWILWENNLNYCGNAGDDVKTRRYECFEQNGKKKGKKEYIRRKYPEDKINRRLLHIFGACHCSFPNHWTCFNSIHWPFSLSIYATFYRCYTIGQKNYHQHTNNNNYHRHHHHHKHYSMAAFLKHSMFCSKKFVCLFDIECVWLFGRDTSLNTFHVFHTVCVLARTYVFI